MAKVGVNLGGWLLLEKWMTPSLFEGTNAVDEFTFMQTPHARQKLRDHHKNFIREEDFKWMAEHGVELVRIPVGYWIFDGDDPFVHCIGRLDWAFKMAEKYNIGVLICLHGAPGSQNGRDHSGKIGPAMWYKNRRYQEQSIVVLERLAYRYANSRALWGMQLLNEPVLKLFHITLRNYYKHAYQRLLSIVGPNVVIIYSDAFTPRMMMNALPLGRKRNIMMDIHWYNFTFFAFKLAPLSVYFWLVKYYHSHVLRQLYRFRRVIIGEWSMTLAHEALAKFPSSQHDELMRRHLSLQLETYQLADAWFYWSYKTEGKGIWNFRSLVDAGVINLKNN